MENATATVNTSDTVRRGRPSPYPEETIQAALAALRSGQKVKEVAQLTGMSTTSVTYYKHKLVPSTPKPRAKTLSQEEMLLKSYNDRIATATAEAEALEADLAKVRETLTELTAKRDRVTAALGL